MRIHMYGLQAKAIGSFSDEKNVKYSMAISDFMKKVLGIEPAHCVIHFMNLDPENVGCCGTTMKQLANKWLLIVGTGPSGYMYWGY